MMRSNLGFWLADIAANFVVVVVIVIAVASQFATVSKGVQSYDIAIRRTVPVGGAAAVELLRQRALTDRTLAMADVTETGLVPLSDQRPEVYLVLSNAPFVNRQVSPPLNAIVFNIPSALRTKDGSWTKAFLELEQVAKDKTRFQNALVKLLSTGGNERNKNAFSQDINGSSKSLLERILSWGNTARGIVNLILLAVAFWGMTRLRRRFVTA